MGVQTIACWYNSCFLPRFLPFYFFTLLPFMGVQTNAFLGVEE